LGATMIANVAEDLGAPLLLTGLVLVGICVTALIVAWLVPPRSATREVPARSAAHKATVGRRARKNQGHQAAGTHQLRH
jgi:hypothetical protein